MLLSTNSQIIKEHFSHSHSYLLISYLIDIKNINWHLFSVKCWNTAFFFFLRRKIKSQLFMFDGTYNGAPWCSHIRASSWSCWTLAHRCDPKPEHRAAAPWLPPSDLPLVNLRCSWAKSKFAQKFPSPSIKKKKKRDKNQRALLMMHNGQQSEPWPKGKGQSNVSSQPRRMRRGSYPS